MKRRIVIWMKRRRKGGDVPVKMKVFDPSLDFLAPNLYE